MIPLVPYNIRRPDGHGGAAFIACESRCRRIKSRKQESPKEWEQPKEKPAAQFSGYLNPPARYPSRALRYLSCCRKQPQGKSHLHGHRRRRCGHIVSTVIVVPSQLSSCRVNFTHRPSCLPWGLFGSPRISLHSLAIGGATAKKAQSPEIEK